MPACNRSSAAAPHRSAQWAAIPETARDGYKFVEAPPPSSTPRSGMGLKQMRSLNADGTFAPKAAKAADASAEAGGGDDDDGPCGFGALGLDGESGADGDVETDAACV